jgi:glycosyltransferase involved in cell wall biosynthesis
MISVITPSFRQLNWLRLCVVSVADQESVEVEHIVQDGGTENIAAALADQPVRLFVEKDAGMYDAINRGLQRARGDICAYLNCDEQYLPGSLQQVETYFSQNKEVDVVFGDAILIDTNGTPISYRRAISPTLSHLRLAHLNTLTCATFFRRRLFADGHHFPTHLKIAGDQLWIFRLLNAGTKMGVIQKPLSVFTFTGHNLSRSAEAVQEKFGWLPDEERPLRWLTPFVVARHRLRKFVAGAYRTRHVAIEIYTRESPTHRRLITGKVGFRWPR